MKKSQLRNIIRKVIKEQFIPNAGMTPKTLELCPCASIDPSFPGVCSGTPVTMDMYFWKYSTQYGYQGLSATPGFVLCLGGLQPDPSPSGGPGGTCDPQDIYVIMQDLGTPANYVQGQVLTGIAHGQWLDGSHPDWCSNAVTLMTNSHKNIVVDICDCQGHSLCNNTFQIGNTVTWGAASFYGWQCNGQACTQADIGQTFEYTHSNGMTLTYTLQNLQFPLSIPASTPNFQNTISANCPGGNNNSHTSIEIEICDCQGTTPFEIQQCNNVYIPGTISYWSPGIAGAGWTCNGQMCTSQDIGQTFETAQPFANTGITLTYKLLYLGAPTNTSYPVDTISSTCPSVLSGSAIYGCKCQIYDHVLGQCPPTAGGGSNYFTTDQETLIGGNSPAPGMTFRPYANTNFVVDSILTPTQPGTTNLAVGSPCNPPPGPTTYDCYPGQGCQQNWQGQGQYSGGTSAQNLQNCETACQTTYDCDGPPNYSCSPNYQGQGQYSGGTTAQNLADCQNACVPPPPITGCMDPNACNYDPNATVYNPSLCDYSCQGCTDPTALNYDPNATMDDGSCIYPSEGCADPNATNYNANNGGCNGDPNDTSCCLYQAFQDFNTGTGLGDKPPADPCYDFNQLPTYHQVECCKECEHATNTGNTSFAPSTCGGLSYQNCGCCKSVNYFLKERLQKLANISKK
jgi:hypothetical protein